MKETQEHLGWQLFRIASNSIPAPVDAGSDDRNDAYCFIGKISPKGTDGSINYTHTGIKDRDERTVNIPLTFKAEVVSKAMDPSICTSGSTRTTGMK